MTNTMMTASNYRKFYARALREAIASDEAYEADVRDWYENGNGRSPSWVDEYDANGDLYRHNVGGLGYTFPYCKHGMSLWTDYDNICGGCEDGASAIQRAQSVARDAFRTFGTRLDWFQSAPKDLPQSQRDALLTWIFEQWTASV